MARALAVEDAASGQSSRMLKRQLSLADLVFLSFGGQAALLSLLTYATGVIIYTAQLAPLVVVLGTIIVLLNAASVYGLSKRYGEAGGYYIYALYSMTRRLGLETGWVYLLYSITYGAAYVFGASYILETYLHVDPVLAALALFVPAAAFLYLGIRPSARYAVVASSVELGILIAIAIADMFIARFHLYDPLGQGPSHVSWAPLMAALLMAIGIPTGYGSITPLGGEAVRKEDVGKAAIVVVIVGGLLAAAVVYTMVDAALATDEFRLLLTARSPVLDFLGHYYGVIMVAPILFAALNDGTLSPLSFMAATSRTIYAMAKYGALPAPLAKLSDGHPRNAVLFTILALALVTFPALWLTRHPFTYFLLYGSLAGLANLFVHISANVSYTLEGFRGFRRALTFSSLKRAGWYLRKLADIVIGLGAAVFSLWALSMSLGSSQLRLESSVFLAWIIIGFVVAEVLEELGLYQRGA